MQVQFEAQKILYGDKILLGDETTSNFEKPENFVVLECVNRLLEKGYKPEHLYLEKKWALGRTGKSGKADISVNSQDGKALLIIECKTFGEEYDKEKKRMIENGGQLFSYLQQDRNTKFLCLYASSLFDDNIIYENSIIPIKDSEEQIEAVKNNIEDAKTYSTANTAEELYEVWKENHNLYFHPNGIFDEEIEPYNIELKPLKKKDLKPFKEGDGGYVFNQFLEILRHNNISDKSNAFNKIMSLFLCKIVDEQKNDNEVLEFQVKEGIDTPESIQDRLLKLYTSGMKQYLKEEIINYSEEDIDKIVNNFPIQTSRLRIKEILKELKFYTNNEFAFKEVHNKKLFKENAKVLNEVIRLFQDKKFKYSKKEQYLGTFFELLLNAGYKQDEGQFFTPVPIVKFIINSLPFEKLVQQKLSNKSRAFLPYVMDYACGSGHFLTESIDKIQNIINVLNYDYDEDTNITIKHFKESAEWAAEFIFGIEKDYRLARTSKVACFMNGDGAANVIFGDGLEKHDRLKDKYEIVVANPPYAIKSFKQHLRVKETDYNLISLLTSDASQIEVLFVERTKQLLTPGGVAGIILPDSLLNSEGIYTKAREIILEYFEVISIVSLGSKTFIATGKDTAIFFLKRRNDSFALDRKFIAIDYILKNKKRAHDFIDSEALLKDYVEVIDITIKDYKTFLSRKPNKQIIESEMYQEYWEWFINSSTYNTFITKQSFTKLKAKEQEKQIAKLFFDNILPIEMEKFYFFMLTKEQETLIVKWDSSVKSQKDILGYEFSKRRGFEEVVMLKEELTDNYITKLYNERDLSDKSKINSYILNAFDGKIIDDCDKSLESIINRVQLSDCLDFSHINFEKVISLDADKQVIESQFPSKRISRLLKPIKGSTEKILESLIKDKGKLPVITQGKEFISGYTDADVSPIDDIPLIVFGDHTTIFKYIDFPFVRGADGLQLLKVDPNEILPKA
ncbi:MAG: N-6 DNA methylase, partial [Ignavibacteriaceae bacterium]|nr:N-6 DNA methylase [Ignavibacteriaceae bacterium]